MRGSTIIILIAAALFIIFAGPPLAKRLAAEIPGAAEQAKWAAMQALQFYDGISDGVKLTCAVLLAVGGFYLGMSYFMATFRMKRF